MAARRSPRRNTVLACTKAKQRKNSGASRSLNGKSPSRKTQKKAVNDVQSDTDNIQVHTPPNKTKTPVSSEKKKGKLSPMSSLMLKSILVHQKRRRLLCRQSQRLQKGKRCQREPDDRRSGRKHYHVHRMKIPTTRMMTKMTRMKKMLQVAPWLKILAIAAVEEGLDDHDSDDDGSTGEESGKIDSDSREQEDTQPHKKKQRRLYQDAVENEEDNNRAEWSAAATHRTSTSGGCSATSPSSGRKTNGESVHGVETGITLICPMLKAEGLRNQEVHIAERVRNVVINHLFCKIKFISNNAMVHEAMKMIMDHEQVPQERRYDVFQMVYTWTFNLALNSKQSTCETADKKCVVDETRP